MDEAQRIALDYMRRHPVVTARRIAARAYVVWFGDVLESWADRGREWWSSRRPYVIALASVTTLTAWITALGTAWAVTSRRLAGLPHRVLFWSIPALLPCHCTSRVSSITRTSRRCGRGSGSSAPSRSIPDGGIRTEQRSRRRRDDGAGALDPVLPSRTS
jgi:hypothetical protein